MLGRPEPPQEFLWREAASPELIADCASALKVVLPATYIEFMRISNGGEGFAGRDDYLLLWPVHELQSLKASYETDKYAPGLLLFGSNGGGEAYGFDTRSPSNPIVQIPFVGMDWASAKEVAAGFYERLERLKGKAGMASPGDPKSSRTLEHRGKEIFDLKPVILGGDPTDPANKVFLDRRDHIEAVRFWNRIIANVKDAPRPRA
jgi:hypothetical protein